MLSMNSIRVVATFFLRQREIYTRVTPPPIQIRPICFFSSSRRVRPLSTVSSTKLAKSSVSRRSPRSSTVIARKSNRSGIGATNSWSISYIESIFEQSHRPESVRQRWRRIRKTSNTWKFQLHQSWTHMRCASNIPLRWEKEEVLASKKYGCRVAEGEKTCTLSWPWQGKSAVQVADHMEFEPDGVGGTGFQPLTSFGLI